MTQIARPAPAIHALAIERFRGINSLKWKPSRGINVVIGGRDVKNAALRQRLAHPSACSPSRVHA